MEEAIQEGNADEVHGQVYTSSAVPCHASAFVTGKALVRKVEAGLIKVRDASLEMSSQNRLFCKQTRAPFPRFNFPNPGVAKLFWGNRCRPPSPDPHSCSLQLNLALQHAAAGSSAETTRTAKVHTEMKYKAA